MTEAIPPFNPYVGPRTFQEEEADRFFGREREARELVALVVSERLTLFYAQSGAGKSSLLNARVIPWLRDREGFTVLPVGRVSGVLPDEIDPRTIDNVFVYHLILGLSQKLAAKEAQPQAGKEQRTADLAHTLLARFLSGETGPDTGAVAEPAATDAEGLVPYVLIIDQFEELLTTYPDRWQERAGFFEQLSAAMARHPNLWIVLTLREDYIAGLEPYSHLAPNRLRARFYMQRMGIESAREAVERPAANAKRPFAEGVAGMLVDNLRMVRTPGQTEYHAGEYVEPVQLQVVCFQLWEDLRGKEAATIELSDLERLAGGGNLAEYVDRALSDFYERAIAKVLETPGIGVSESALRNWFSNKLITEAGTRSIVFRNETTGETDGLSNPAVNLLTAQFLLRTELRAGGAWVELTHDRLVEPIRESNGAWLMKNQSALERQAAIWRDEGKPPNRLLLAGDDLVEAERWAAEHERELEPYQKELLAASKAARDAAERELEAEREAARQRELEAAQALAEEQRQRADEQALAAGQLRRRALIAATLAIVAVILGIAAAGFGFKNSQNASLAATRAVAAETSAAAAAAAEAEARVNAAAAATAETEAEANAAAAVAAEAEARVNAAAAVAAEADTKRALERAISQRIVAQVKSVAESGSLDVASLLVAEALRKADTPEAREAMNSLLLSGIQTYLYAQDVRVGSIAFSQDGRTLVSGEDGDRLVVWSELTTGSPVSRTLDTGMEAIQAVAADPNAGKLAAGDTGGRIRLWDGARRPPRLLDGAHADSISRLAFSPDGRFLVSASQDGKMILWPLAAPRADFTVLEERARLTRAIAFSPDPAKPLRLAVGDDGGQVTIWTDLEAQQPVRKDLQIGEAISATVASLAFDPAGTRLAIGFDDGRFAVWDLEGGRQVFDPVDAGDDSVESLAFDLQDDSLAVLLADGSLNRYLLAALEAGSPPPAYPAQPILGASSAALTADGRGWAIGLDTGAILLGRTGGPPPLDANADPEALIQQACRIANRNLSESEWYQLIGEDVPYRKTCPALE